MNTQTATWKKASPATPMRKFHFEDEQACLEARNQVDRDYPQLITKTCQDDVGYALFVQSKRSLFYDMEVRILVESLGGEFIPSPVCN